ncbi:peptide-methionine (R)-S-oxide reductase [Francisella halioticida]|uniref:peptide-methionine (R)-S-oxide reductase n=1 Tax=Francisella halioticida TaxID=549298 RepID=A0ABM6M101_9GAMM|nr:peptide-methionine (R)-S-oxide reductase MsrB [Francisella halioticida]ASG68645.1 peptide-methionine (R)-S-oxide reductase [Francisella halioticida]
MKKLLTFIILIVPILGFSETSKWQSYNKPEALSKLNKLSKLSKLSKLQYYVTQKGGTERAFNNKYWNNHKQGIYVDIVSGEPLFSSTNKYITQELVGLVLLNRLINQSFIVTKVDNSWFMNRTEVLSKHGKSHLGHIFDDGPKPSSKRYCMNSAALRFIPKADMKKDGYSAYLYLFNKNLK